MDLTTAPDAGRITDEAIAKLRSRLGQVISTSHAPYLTETSRDAVRHWAEGIGDTNPIWFDDERAKKSPWGKPLCPPTILYAFDHQSIGYRGGFPGIHSMFGGSDFHWLRPLTWGERIHAVVKFIDLIERPSRFAGRAFQQISEITFLTDSDEVVCVKKGWGFRTERKAAAEKGKYKDVTITRYTPAEIEKIAEKYANEFVRGSEMLYIDDVKAGDEVPTIVRGPYTVTTALAFEMGWGGIFIKSHGPALEYYQRHPKAGLVNSFGVPEPPEAVHWDTDLAKKVGVAAAYDYGPERISWVGSALTNWIGDAGFLEKLYVEVRHHNIIGDLTTCGGTVVAVAPAEGTADLEVWAKNQHGVTTARGTARVRLPSRTKGQTRAATPQEAGVTGRETAS